jgi:CRISPR-associated protein Csm5
MRMRGNWQYHMQVLTPLHIGSGQTLLPIEYVIDKSQDQVIRVDIPRFFRLPGFPIQKYTSQVKQAGFNLQGDFRQAALKCPLYVIKAGGNLAELQSASYESQRILEHIREVGQPYVPGSSLKGALRSMLLRCIVKDHQINYEAGLQNEVEQVEFMDSRGKNRKKTYFSSRSEQRLLGDPNHSLLRVLQVSDSSRLDPSGLQLGCVKVLSQNQYTYRWKILGGEMNTEDAGKATPVFFEALAPGTKLEGRIKIDANLMSTGVARQLLFEQKLSYIDNLVKYLQDGANRLLEHEKQFYEKLEFNPGIRQIEYLQKELQDCGDDSFILPLGWGTGYLAKAAGWIINVQLMERIRHNFAMGRPGFALPKSRKICFAQGEAVALPGWVRISLQP